MAVAQTFAILLGAAIAALLWWSLPSKMPPGPPRLPIIGNLHQMTNKFPWRQIQGWHKIYGPIMTVKAGQTVLISLGSHEAVRELFTHRSPIYSSRPRLVVAQECLSKGFGSAVLPYGPVWKRNRRIQMSVLNPRRNNLYQPLQELESCHLLWRLLSGHDFYNEMHRYSASTVYALLYGKRFITGEEPELAEVDQLTASLQHAISFGTWLVDLFPVLNHLPRRFCKWQDVGDDYHQRQVVLYGQNATAALKSPSWNWTKQMTQGDHDSATNKEINFLLGELFEASSHTTSGSLIAAVLACVSYPETLHRAQQEIDKVVGDTRLPSLDDVPNLPYVQAFVTEALRWRPVFPSGLPHAPIRDDAYAGFPIPEGTAVLASFWSLNMDEAVFKNPYEFCPERWLENPDLPLTSFGFGRRICPGRQFARQSLFLAMSQLMWAFDIRCEPGMEQKISSLEQTNEGVFTQPCRFKASFLIRSSQHEKLVLQSWNNIPSSVDETLSEIGSRF